MKPKARFGKTFTFEVRHDGRTAAISKDTRLYPDEYWVECRGSKHFVFINRRRVRFPVDLQFAANLPITHVGFASRGDIPRCRKEGSCGGCFSLVTDIPEGGSLVSPLIRNGGDNPRGGYRFRLYLRHERGEVIFDPQIYNEGQPPGGELPWWRRIFRF